MARHTSPDSVASRVGAMHVDEVIKFSNPYSSVMVMVSNLKRKKEHHDKIFKIKAYEAKTFVTRIK